MTEQVKVKFSLDKSDLKKKLSKAIFDDKKTIEAWAGYNDQSGVRHITEAERQSNERYKDEHFKDAKYVDIAFRQEYGDGVRQRPFMTYAYENIKKIDFGIKKYFSIDRSGRFDWQTTAENFAEFLKNVISATIAIEKYAKEERRTIRTKKKSTPLIWTGGLIGKAIVKRTKVK